LFGLTVFQKVLRMRRAKGGFQINGGVEYACARTVCWSAAGIAMTTGSAIKVKTRRIARELKSALEALKSVLLLTLINQFKV
jgi:hypothetical protein